LKIKLESEIDGKLVYSDSNEEIFVYDKIQTFSGLNREEILFKTKDGIPCGFIKNLGEGKIFVFGSGLNHTFDYHIDIVKKIAEKLGVKPSIIIEPFAEVDALLRKNNEFGFLFLINYQELDKFIKLKLVLPGEKKFIKIPHNGTIFLKQRNSLILPLNVPLNDKVLLRYTTAEVMSYKTNKKKDVELILQTNELSYNELEFFVKEKPKYIKINDKKYKFSYENKIVKIVLPKTNNVQKIMLTV